MGFANIWNRLVFPFRASGGPAENGNSRQTTVAKFFDYFTHTYIHFLIVFSNEQLQEGRINLRLVLSQNSWDTPTVYFLGGNAIQKTK